MRSKDIMITLQEAIETLKDKIADDYTRGGFNKSKEQFRDELTVNEGSSYIKILYNNGVWGFIVKTESDRKFLKGDILKAAGYRKPARNRARGNILNGDFSWVRWTGPAYLN
tara:strand:- start:1024 stop:1359 length:336 start_codon:yes stop_codon:yes gene_type:complete